MPVEIKDLLKDVMGHLPADHRKAVTALVDEYGASDTCHFMLALVAGATKRERRLTRMLLNELEKLSSQ